MNLTNQSLVQGAKKFLGILFSICAHFAFSQSIEIKGKVVSSIDVENIHVINKTGQLFTITDKSGAFLISAKSGDTLIFSSIQHQVKTVVIDEDIMIFKSLLVTLEEKVNKLDEVVVGKILTGDLHMDIGNAEDDTPINFYDVGIPGYKGKIATQSERRFDQANGDGLNYKTLILQVLTANVAIDPIINGISGRTKMLKSHLKIEEEDNLLRQIKVRFAEDFFGVYQLNETLQMDFLYFCQEDANFSNRCKGKSDIEIWEFLKEKYIVYKENMSKIKE